MSPEEKALLEAVCLEPHEDAPRLAYAAWLEGQTPPNVQGEAMRLAIETEGKKPSLVVDSDDRMALLEAIFRLRKLRREHKSTWKQAMLAIADDCQLHLGLVASVKLDAGVFLKRAEDLFTMAPIVHVQLTGLSDFFDDFLGCPFLGRIYALTLTDQGLTDDNMYRLTHVSALDHLWYLDLSDNLISLRGVEIFACSPFFKQLSHVVLDGNPGDVHERCGVEEAIVHVWFPRNGDRLEARYGRIPWLHFPEACWSDYPPDPCGPPQY